MGAINNNLYGLWKMTAMRYQNDTGSWESESVFGGTSMFTSRGHILTFTSAEIPFGYSGTFTMQGDDLVITPEVCSIPELEKTTIRRTVKSITAETLTLGMVDSATGRNYEIDLKLLAKTFN